MGNVPNSHLLAQISVLVSVHEVGTSSWLKLIMTRKQALIKA